MKRIAIAIILILIAGLSVHFLLSYRNWNVLLITLDTTRLDYLSCYNPKTPATPNIDRIAAKSMVFDDAYSLIPITFPAHSSIFFSRPPYELNVFNNGDVLAKQGSTLAELLKQNGYATGAFLSLGSLKKIFGLSAGFDTYGETFRGRWYSVASEVNHAAFPWITANANKPFFAWVHYSDPHFPYVTVDALPDTEVLLNGQSLAKVCLAKKDRNEIHLMIQPGINRIVFRAIGNSGATGTYLDPVWFQRKDGIEWDYANGWMNEGGRHFVNEASIEMQSSHKGSFHMKMRISGKLALPVEKVRETYAKEIQYMDRHLGELWDLLGKLNLLKKTILIITADHGEGLGERKRVGHLFPLTQELTHVPFLIYYPSIGRTGRSDALVSHLDVMPTILDLLHIKTGNVMRGQSLKGRISLSPIDWIFAERSSRSRVFSETYAPQGKSNAFAMVQDGVKLIETRRADGWKWEMYDLHQDPLEKENLSPRPELKRILQDYGRDAELSHSRHKNPELDEDARKMLKDLGYIQ